MAKIGAAEYPELTFTEAVEAIEEVKREKIQTTEGLGKLLGHTNMRSGSLYVKLGALNKYFGLIDQNKAEFKLTPLAKRIVYPVDDSDRKTACAEAVGRVALLRDLFAKLGSDYNRDEFKPLLKTLTNASPEELEARTGQVEKLYQDAIRYLGVKSQANLDGNTGGAVYKGSEGDEGVTPDAPPGPPAVPGVLYETLKGDDGTFVRVPLDPDIIEDVKGHLEVWLKKAQRKKQVPPPAA